MTDAVIYARVPEEAKRAAETFKVDHGISLAAAIAILIALGADSGRLKKENGRLLDHVRQLTDERDAARAQLDQVRGNSAALEASNRALASAYQAVAAPLDRSIGTCATKGCGKVLRGSDLLVTGVCSSCGTDLATLIAPARGTVDPNQYLLLLGAVGLLLGIAMLQSKGQQ
jgi:hypothetical protein